MRRAVWISLAFAVMFMAGGAQAGGDAGGGDSPRPQGLNGMKPAGSNGMKPQNINGMKPAGFSAMKPQNVNGMKQGFNGKNGNARGFKRNGKAGR